MPRPTHPLNSHLPRRCWLPFPSPHPPPSQAASSGLVLGVSSRSSSSGYKLFFKSIWAVHPQVPASCCSQTQFKLPSPETPSSHRARAILKYSPLEPQAPVANRLVFKLWSQVLSLLVRASDTSRFCIGKGSNPAFVPTTTGCCLWLSPSWATSRYSPCPGLVGVVVPESPSRMQFSSGSISSLASMEREGKAEGSRVEGARFTEILVWYIRMLKITTLIWVCNGF
ncbi:hypothetical protein DFH08DRAFT_808786 [Mycena albidolilacea]|uniref:Uncharacterized protein n=1 Tax=Mycena albidolilacea TaxID=1033008 RepID=A0AAD7ESQ2_9AGAR|nr:hypothetical protein DFH08DRAFT_808786 [Mycena albidolilacea]